MASNAGLLILKKQYQDLKNSTAAGAFSVGLEDDQWFTWRVALTGPIDSPYEGGIFTALLSFPEDFPNNPPEMRFICPIFHPNVYPDGKVCISILHPPGVDQFNEQESADERWRPIISVEAIILSVISMLGEPNPDSPANLDASKLFKRDVNEFNKKVRRMVEDM